MEGVHVSLLRASFSVSRLFDRQMTSFSSRISVHLFTRSSSLSPSLLMMCVSRSLLLFTDALSLFICLR